MEMSANVFRARSVEDVLKHLRSFTSLHREALQRNGRAARPLFSYRQQEHVSNAADVIIQSICERYGKASAMTQ